MRSLALLLAFVAGCGPAGRPMATHAQMDQRQDLWRRCRVSISAAQCGDDHDAFYQAFCMRSITDRFFDTRSLSAAREIALANGCPASMVGGGSGGDSSYGSGSASAPGPRTTSGYATRRSWGDGEMRDMIVRINDAVVSCFGTENLPARIMMTIDTHGHVTQHAVASVHTDDEAGCVARLLVSIDVEGSAVRESRTITATFGDATPSASSDAASEVDAAMGADAGVSE